MANSIIDDPKRLKILREFIINDYDSSNFYQQFSTFIAQLYDVPIVLISIIEDEKQFFKAHYGVSETEINLEYSICKHILMEQSPLFIPDITDDIRSKNNIVACNQFSIKFYAGIALIFENTYIGSICIMDKKLRPDLTRDTLDIMTKFGDMVIAYMKAYKKLSQIIDHSSDLNNFKK